MNCREFIDFLMDYLDDELPAARAAAFEHHLGECPECTDYLDSYRKTVEVGRGICMEMDESVPAEVPEDLVAAILEARRAGG